MSGTSEDLKRVCRRFDIRTVFPTISTLRRQLARVKDVYPLLSRSGVVCMYSIPYSYGKEYIGETKTSLGTNIKNIRHLPGEGKDINLL